MALVEVTSLSPTLADVPAFEAPFPSPLSQPRQSLHIQTRTFAVHSSKLKQWMTLSYQQPIQIVNKDLINPPHTP